ncbi:unnamed protein product, partial [Closterium sp. Yama58-4]
CAPMAEAIRDAPLPPCPWGQARIDGNCADKCKFAGCGTDSVCKKNDTGDAVCVCINPEYVLQPDKSCAHPCAGTWCAMDDPNSSCVKQEGQLATCVCNWGFAMTPDRGCVDSCRLKACVDGTCSKDENGMAVCSCDAEAGFKLQLDGRTCKDVCVIEDCEGKDANSTCVRNLDVAHCVCKTNFQLFEGVCTDTCEVKACVDGTCTQDVNGTASCHCDADAGLVLLDDERTCQDVCIIKDCEGSDANSTCVKNGIVATCVCKTGFELFDGKCTDTCEVKACVDGTCTKDVNGTASCHCDADAGLVLLDDERTCQDVCIIEDCEGKDAKSMCVRNRDVAHCECVINYELFQGVCTDTCEVKACVNGLCRQNSITGAASCHCDADAGFVLLDGERTCKDVCIIKDCEGSDANSTCVKNGTDATCVCKTGFNLFEGKCIDTCELKGCGVNGKCHKDSTTGEPSCVCDLGFTLQPDGTTCKDNCEILSCTGPKEHCAKEVITGQAYCKCDDYFHRAVGGFCQDWCPFKGCNTTISTCVRRVDGIPFCICNKGVPLTTKACVGKVPSAWP